MSPVPDLALGNDAPTFEPPLPGRPEGAASAVSFLGEEAGNGDWEKWKLVRRILASRGFRKSELLQKFLLEICECALAGKASEISEHHLGVRVFGRPQGYDPGEDNIVRSYARMLRKRLEVYFSDEGAQERLSLMVPRGGYVPEFARMQNSTAVELTSVPIDEDDPAEEMRLPIDLPAEMTAAVPGAETATVPAANASRSTGFVGVVAGMIFGALTILLAWAAVSTVQAHRNMSPAHTLWRQVFDKNHATIIVPADSGLGIVENLTHTQASLDGYANGDYLASLRSPAGIDRGNFGDVTRQRYTSVVDLNIATALARLPEFTPERARIRFARDFSLAEMRNSNVILLGSSHANPWVTLFEPRLNFVFAYTDEVDRSFIVNKLPKAGEQPRYVNGSVDGHSPTYGIVAYLPDAGGLASVLIIEGLNMAGTEAAANILFDAGAIQPALREASASDGRLHAFELLIETTSVGSSAATARILATRIYPET